MPEVKLTRKEKKRLTRQRLIEAGADLLRRRPVGDVTAQVRAQDIVPVAGVSTGAFYHHWETQEQYIRDLLEYVLHADRFRPHEDQTIAGARQAAEAGAPLEFLIRSGADMNFWIIAAHPYFRLQVASWAGLDAEGDEHVRFLLRKLYNDLNAKYIALYIELLEHYEREPAEAWGRQSVHSFARHLAVLLNALTEGLVMRYAVDPEAVLLPEHGEKATLLGEGALQIFLGMTRPRRR